MKSFPAAVLMLVWLAASVAPLAQAANLSGKVTDPAGLPLPGVVITAVCPATNLTRTATSDAQGGYSVPELPICDVV